MRRSIFWKITLIILPIVLITDGLVIAASYRIAYNSSYHHCEEKIEGITDFVTNLCSMHDLSAPGASKSLDNSLSYLCRVMQFSYIYALKVDLENNTETILAIGFGDDASEEAKEERKSGTVVTGLINQEEIDVATGKKELAYVHEITRYGDTLTGYTRVTKSDVNVITSEYKELDNNVIIGMDISMTRMMKSFQQNAIYLALLTLTVSIVIALSFATIVYLKISKPARRISRRMSSFVEDYSSGIQPLEIKGNDEFAEMSRSFNTMAENIDTYLSNISELNREKHTQEAEMDIAGNIQQGLLRKPHLEADGYKIDAYMLAAKEVGGDLYCYEVLNDGRIYLAVGDVSGKGISASLFMSCAVTLLHVYAALGYSPARTLAEYNNVLAGQNPNGLFITTFVAVADLNAGTLTYTNGGHNIPYLLSDEVRPLEGASGVAAGIFPDLEYEEVTVPLKKGDRVFLYSDGVNEAQNAAGDLFSTERLEEELRLHKDEDSDELIESVLKRLEAFTEGAPQSDDITMLVFKTESARYNRTLRLAAQTQELTMLTDVIDEIPYLSPESRMNLYIIAEEIFVNICSYAYDNSDGEVNVTIDVNEKAVTLVFSDNGKPYDPTQDVVEIDDYDHSQAIGGLGRFITFRIADSYSYEYKDGKNVLTIVKNLD